jgi:hypothetical protein
MDQAAAITWIKSLIVSNSGASSIINGENRFYYIEMFFAGLIDSDRNPTAMRPAAVAVRKLLQ